jgi:hypothetical protein
VREAEEIPLFFTLIPILTLLSNYDRGSCLINVGTEGSFSISLLQNPQSSCSVTVSISGRTVQGPGVVPISHSVSASGSECSGIFNAQAQVNGIGANTGTTNIRVSLYHP